MLKLSPTPEAATVSTCTVLRLYRRLEDVEIVTESRSIMRAFVRLCQAARPITRPSPLRSPPLQPVETRAAFALRPFPIYSRPFRRFQTTTTPDPASKTSASVSIAPERKPWRAAPHRRPDEPVYELYFTCKTCKERSGHSISKQGYHHGTTLVQCPGCNNRHLISDHLKIFSDKGVTLEDILREKGETVKLGSLDRQGDVEFWDETAADKAEGAKRMNFGT